MNSMISDKTDGRMESSFQPNNCKKLMESSLIVWFVCNLNGNRDLTGMGVSTKKIILIMY